MSSYVYQRRGGPLLNWDSPSRRPPYQSRAADATSLGTWEPPRPGAPEVIGDLPEIPNSWLFAASILAWMWWKKKSASR